MWRREMEWLLSVSDHIVELTPNWQTFPDGSKLEVMRSCIVCDDYLVCSHLTIFLKCESGHDLSTTLGSVCQSASSAQIR